MSARDLLQEMGVQRWRLRPSLRQAVVDGDDVRASVDHGDADLSITTSAEETKPLTSQPVTSKPLSSQPFSSKPLSSTVSASQSVDATPCVDDLTPDIIAEVATDAVLSDSPRASAIKPAPSVSSQVNPLDDADWQALQAIIDAGTVCPTCSAKNAVLGYGDTTAKWLFVFDAPTSLDLQSDQLCSGRAGKLFDAILQALKLARDQVYVTSVFKCAPTEDLALNPACHSILRRQIELVQPTVVVTFGEFAAQSVLKANESLEQLRQQLQRCFSTQIPIVPTYSPNQMLDNPQLKSLVWNDLKVAIGLQQKPSSETR